jgi:hypothetical protein
VKNPPEYRAFRFAAWSLYFVATAFACGCLLVSVYSGARERMGQASAVAPVEAVDVSALRGCMHDLDALHAELTEQLDFIRTTPRATQLAGSWEKWSPGWRQRLIATGARCRLTRGDVPGASALKAAYDRLGSLHGHYTTLVTQFAKEIGPISERLQAAMEAARKSVSQLPGP